MGFYWVKTNFLIKKIFSNYIWSIPNHENKIYITFDDGPTPEVTEWVLSELEKFKAKATFFCIGDNIQKHPFLFEKIIQSKHAIGNHTFNHLNGWKTGTKEYIENSIQCSEVSGQFPNFQLSASNSQLFRPPYGKIKLSQSKKMRQLGYKIMMWDVLSADFDAAISPEKCLKNTIENTKSGSIIVFHDSEKAFTNLKYTLPKALKYWKENGFVFEVIR